MPTTKKRRPSAPAPSAISGQLREIISGRGLTAYAVAQSAEVSPSVVSRFLSRERGLTLETFDAIAGALGLRLVETGRGRGRPASRATRTGPGRQDPAEVLGTEGDGDEVEGAGLLVNVGAVVDVPGPIGSGAGPHPARPEVADGGVPGEDGEVDHILEAEEMAGPEPDGDRPEQAEHDDRA